MNKRFHFYSYELALDQKHCVYDGLRGRGNGIMVDFTFYIVTLLFYLYLTTAAPLCYVLLFYGFKRTPSLT